MGQRTHPSKKGFPLQFFCSLLGSIFPLTPLFAEPNSLQCSVSSEPQFTAPPGPIAAAGATPAPAPGTFPVLSPQEPPWLRTDAHLRCSLSILITAAKQEAKKFLLCAAVGAGSHLPPSGNTKASPTAKLLLNYSSWMQQEAQGHTWLCTNLISRG